MFEQFINKTQTVTEAVQRSGSGVAVAVAVVVVAATVPEVNQVCPERIVL